MWSFYCRLFYKYVQTVAIPSASLHGVDFFPVTLLFKVLHSLSSESVLFAWFLRITFPSKWRYPLCYNATWRCYLSSTPIVRSVGELIYSSIIFRVPLNLLMLLLLEQKLFPAINVICLTASQVWKSFNVFSRSSFYWNLSFYCAALK